MVTGQQIMRLAAAGPEGRHALGARFGGFSHGGTCRAIAWFKAEPSVGVMIEARDTHDPLTESRRITALLRSILPIVRS